MKTERTDTIKQISIKSHDNASITTTYTQEYAK